MKAANSEIAASVAENSKWEKLLEIKVYSKRSFKTHVEDLCKKASRKIHALATVTLHMNFEKKRILFNNFFQIPL